MRLISLPPGTEVGAWRVLGFRGRGMYGTVYAAERVDRKRTGPAVLKLAISPADARFEREAELLARIRHPSVPRLLDAGLWRAPSGGSHPFVVMECVEGVPLYTWAERSHPSSRQVLALLAQAAGALQATHEVSSVHRDVKGDNMLVRASDGRLFLTDFGTGYFAGAARLTPMPLLPGTPAYRSPEMWRYLQRAGPDASAPLMARPSDDVFALGVTAYRLVTGTYPPSTDPDTLEGQCWLPGGGGATPPRQLNPRVDAQLNALILRMLSPRPEERGTAGELAEAMERGVAHAGPLADTPLFERVGTIRRGKARSWLPWLAAAMALGLWPEKPGWLRTRATFTADRGGSNAEGDAVSLGEDAVSSSEAPAKAPQDAIAKDLPRQPQPGQLRPDAKGQCRKGLVAINGGCWLKMDLEPNECRGHDVYLYQGGCYFPIPASQPLPTSEPVDSEH
ncbi:MAG TPA: serine/threonine-protein kinase [Myxococcaceae bacterium]|nr:serine/threonine-protein kinase [Myxococcaceae bacterium]